MSFSQPSPPDPYTTAALQSQMNLQAAQEAAGLSEGNTINPLSTTIVQGAGGANPTYTQTLSQPQQALLNQWQGGQNYAGQVGGEMLANMGKSGMYSTPQDFTSMASPLVQSQMAAFNQYMQPTFTSQENNLSSRLFNQGIAPGPGGPGGATGNDAYTNAWRGQMQSEDQAAQNALMQFEPQAYNQAVTGYQMPLQMMQSLFGMSNPQGIQQLQPQPTMYQTQNPQAPNLLGAVEQQYGQQLGQFENTMQGLSTLGTAGIRGLFGLAGANPLAGL